VSENNRFSCLKRMPRPGAQTGSLRSGKGRLLLIAVWIAISCAFSASAQATQKGKPNGDGEGNAAHGKELYVKNACYQCHGYLGQGGTSSGVRIAPDPLPWQAIAAYIRKPAGTMPPYTSKLVPDKDVQDIYAYLKSVPGPVDLKNIPTFTK